MIKKALTKVKIEGTQLNIIKAIYGKLTAKIIFTGEKLKAFSLIQNKTRMPTVTTSSQHSIGSPNLRSQTRKRNKIYQNWKGKGKIATVM